MTVARDPRTPKSNSRARRIDQGMRDCWSAYRQNKDHAIRRHSLEKLRELIAQWLAEPEVVHDLETGRRNADPQGRERWSKLSPENVEFPFDRGGEAQDRFFYFGSGIHSELMSGETVQRDINCIFNRVAYFVTLVEKRYATSDETRMHFSSDTAFRVHAGQSSAGPKHLPGNHLVCIDPAGCFDGTMRVAFAAVAFEKARAYADEFARKFQVRCVVGRVVRSIDTH